MRVAIACAALLFAALPWVAWVADVYSIPSPGWISATAILLGLFAYSAVTRIEGRARLDEDLLEQIMMHTNQGVVLYDDNERMLVANDISRKIWGVTREIAPPGATFDLITERLMNVVPNKPIHLAREYMEQRRAAMKKRVRASFSNTRTNGGLLNSDLYPISGQGMLWILTNHNEREAFINELIKAKEAAESNGKLQSDFFIRLSHELRTPLNAILGFSEMIGHKLLGDNAEKYAEYGRNIHLSGQHIMELLNGILDFSRMGAGYLVLNTDEFDLRETVDVCRTMISATANKKRISIKYIPPAEAMIIQADSGAVRQVLLNLLSNAVKFTPMSGEVSITLRRDGPDMEIAVADTGMGIKPEDMPHIFEPFHRGSSEAVRKIEGTGLGLVICQYLVGKHGGKIHVDSEVGKGTRVVVRLPARQPEAEPGKAA